MLFNNLTDIVPQPQSTNVALNTPIVVTFKDEQSDQGSEKLLEVTRLTTTQVLQQFPPVDKTEIVRCEGSYSYNKSTKTLTFIPLALLLPSTLYTVILRLPNEPEKSFTFTTEPPLKSIRLLTQIYQSKSPSKRMIVLSRQSNLFAELKAKLAAKMKVPATLIHKIFVSHQNETHEIRNERDVYLLSEMNLIWIALSETEESTVVVQLPTISYEEYVAMHWAPKWAGFYIIGCEKASEEEEAQIISALFDSFENKENV